MPLVFTGKKKDSRSQSWPTGPHKRDPHTPSTKNDHISPFSFLHVQVCVQRVCVYLCYNHLCQTLSPPQKKVQRTRIPSSCHIHGGGSGGDGGGRNLLLTEQKLFLVLVKELRGAVFVQKERVHSLDVVHIHLCTLVVVKDTRGSPTNLFCSLHKTHMHIHTHTYTCHK